MSTEITTVEEPTLLSKFADSRYGSRKFIIAVIAMISPTTLVAFKLIEGTMYVTVMLAAIGIYSLANVSQKAITK